MDRIDNLRIGKDEYEIIVKDAYILVKINLFLIAGEPNPFPFQDLYRIVCSMISRKECLAFREAVGTIEVFNR